MILMVNLAEIPQWVMAAAGVILGFLLFYFGLYMRARRFPQLPDEPKVKCPKCGGTNLQRWKEIGSNYIEYKCHHCDEIFYPNQ